MWRGGYTARASLSGSPPYLLGPVASQGCSALIRQILWVGRRAALLQAGFPAGHRRTDRQALAGGEGQVGRGAVPLSLADRPRPGRAGSLWEEGPGVAHTKPWGDGCHLGRALHLIQIATRAPVTSLRPHSAPAEAELVYVKTEAEEVELCSSCSSPATFLCQSWRPPCRKLLGAKAIYQPQNQTSRSWPQRKPTAHSYASHYFKCFSYIYILDPHNNLMREVLASSSFHR